MNIGISNVTTNENRLRFVFIKRLLVVLLLRRIFLQVRQLPVLWSVKSYLPSLPPLPILSSDLVITGIFILLEIS